jgi:hypothetical protein
MARRSVEEIVSDSLDRLPAAVEVPRLHRQSGTLPATRC